MKLLVQKGKTSYLANIFIQDSSSSTGAGLTGLVFNSSSLVCYRSRSDDGNAGGTAITLATQTKGTWATGGFIEKDATNMPGVYEIGITNASLATGSDYCVLMFKGATNMAPCVLEIQLTGIDVEDAVRAGMTALPNVASGSAGAIPTTGTGANQISVSSGQVILQSGTGTGQLSFTSGILKVDVDTIKTNPVVNGGTITFPTNATLASTTNITAGTITTVTTVTNQLTAASIATGVWQDATAGDFTTASSIGKSLYTSGVVPGGTNGLFIAGTNAATTITTALTTTFTGNLTGSVGSVTGAVGSVTGAVGSVTGNVGGNVTGSVGSIATNGIARASFAAETGLQTIRSNTAQAGGATTITLDASASAVDSFYNNDIVFITGGTGVGQSRFVSAYVGATKVATVAAWVTNPDNTSTFAILPFDAIAGASAPTVAQIATGVWQDATAGDFTTANSIGKALYINNVVPGAAGGHFIAGTNAATSITTALTANIVGNITGNLSGSVGSVTAGVIVTTNNDKTGYALTSAYDYAKGTVAMTESYAANGVAPTPIQATYAIHQLLMDFSIASTSYTVKKLDNSTTAFVGTLDSATAPTSLVRT